MSIQRITVLSLLIFCLGFPLVISAGQAALKNQAISEIGASLKKAKRTCATDQTCLKEVANLEKGFTDFKDRQFTSAVELNKGKKKLIEAANSIKPTPQPGSNENTKGTTSEDEQRQGDPLISEVRAALKEAREAVAALTTDAPQLSQRLKTLERKESAFQSDLNRSSEPSKLTDDANAIKEEAGRIKDEADAMASPSLLSSLFTVTGLIWSCLLLFGLSVLVFAALVFVRLQRRVSDLEVHRHNLKQSHDRLKGVVADLKTYSESVGEHLTKAKGDIGAEVEGLRQLYHDNVRNARIVQPSLTSRPVLSSSTSDSLAEVEPSFPALASDYLSKTPNNKKKELESDFRTNLLIPALGGPFTLVEDDDGGGMGIVLPKPRLQKSAEFSSYYKSYYFCDSPSAGEVYIIEPAIVNKSGAGWQLYKMGILETR